MSIVENLENIKKRMLGACQRSNRNLDEITLVNVSKTKPIEILIEGYDAGMRVFGENKVQEIRDKYKALKKENISWHMIGHLQRNKVKYIVDKVDLIHSVDSIRLAKTINEESEKKGVISNVLIQLNIADEESKYGFKITEVYEAIKLIATFKHLRIKGLMTIAPYVNNPEENRWVFRKLKELSVDIKEQNLDNVCMEVLSMGMTGDFEVAIEEGSTMIRIGTALFGERNYTKG